MQFDLLRRGAAYARFRGQYLGVGEELSTHTEIVGEPRDLPVRQMQNAFGCECFGEAQLEQRLEPDGYGTLCAGVSTGTAGVECVDQLTCLVVQEATPGAQRRVEVVRMEHRGVDDPLCIDVLVVDHEGDARPPRRVLGDQCAEKCGIEESVCKRRREHEARTDVRADNRARHGVECGQLDTTVDDRHLPAEMSREHVLGDLE
ncbi:Uncharacterised protein [Mycobacteroides abscessus subsp. abscessus]|nr:Uncharacterised protein [Mycobacteroides abscessus subsp. abscessus]